MKVTLAKSAGFCFGVKRAVETVYNEIEQAKTPIYTFGPIIHNEEVVADYTDDQRTEIANKANDQYLKMAKEGKYKDILVKFGQNGNYSLNNLLYMLSQNPNATVAKGMGEWERAGRSIKKGAKSMEIMAPTKEEYEVAAKDEAGNDMYDEDGVQIMNKRERTIGFHPNYVFDVKDTEGEKYESYKIGEKISDAEKSIILEGVRRALQTKRYRMVFTNGADFADGENFKVDVDNRTLKVKKNMKNAETSLAAIEGASKDVMVVGFDATDDAIAAINEGRMAATIAQQPDLIGKTAVENAVKLIAGEAIEANIPVEVALVTAE